MDKEKVLKKLEESKAIVEKLKAALHEAVGRVSVLQELLQEPKEEDKEGK